MVPWVWTASFSIEGLAVWFHGLPSTDVWDPWHQRGSSHDTTYAILRTISRLPLGKYAHSYQSYYVGDTGGKEGKKKEMGKLGAMSATQEMAGST